MTTSATEGTSATYLRNFVLNAVSNAASQESFVDNNGEALYLYREYTDIYRYSSESYHVLDTFNYKGKLMNADNLGSQNNTWAFGSSSDKCGNAIIRVNDAGTYNTVYHNIANMEKCTQSTSLYDSARPIKDFVLANTYMKSSGNRLRVDKNIFDETSSLNAIDKGFLYDTIKLQNQVGAGKNISYYNFTEGNTCFTLASGYLLNFNEAWGICNKQLERLHAIQDDKYSVSRKTIKDVTGNITNNQLLGLPLGYYAGDISGIQSIEALKDASIPAGSTTPGGSSTKIWKDLSSYFFGLYTESPFYYFNFNLRDQLASYPDSDYTYDADAPGDAGLSNGSHLDNVSKLLLANNQDYFFNLTEYSGDGYGELRDYMNFHDLFYYVMPALRQGVDIARAYDELFGFNPDEDCAVQYNSTTGKVTYIGNEMSLEQFVTDYYNKDDEFTEEEKYKIWHTLNNYSIMNAYSAWLDTMLDCDYAKPQYINVNGEHFKVANPLDPTCYFNTDPNSDKLSAGRYMVFSRSEMKYYGLTEADLTTVESKIIEVQDRVYEKSINLMNYYTLSDETLLQAFSMIQLFEFNKVFSQERFIGSDYVMYPQGYELKAFSYDAYLRLIVAESSGEDLMTSNTDENGAVVANQSLYTRVQGKTSIFFSLFLITNDLLAVYIIPACKLLFIIILFIISVLLLVASAVKLELNIFKVVYRSLLAPLAVFSMITIGMAFVVSMFMTNGATGVISNSLTIDMGDPTMVVIVVLVINATVTLLYWKLFRKTLSESASYAKMIADNVGSAVLGVGGSAINVATGSRLGNLFKAEGVATNMASTAAQRGRDNMPTTGRTGIGTSRLHAKDTPEINQDLLHKYGSEYTKELNNRRNNASVMNKYDRKAYAGVNSKVDAGRVKLARLEHAASLQNGIPKPITNARLAVAKAKQNALETYAQNINSKGRFRAGLTYVKDSAGVATNMAGKFGQSVRSGSESIYHKGLYAMDEAKNIKGNVTRAGLIKAQQVKDLAGKGINATKQGATNLRDKVTSMETYTNLGVSFAKAGNNRRAFIKSTKAGVVNGLHNVEEGLERGGEAFAEGLDKGVRAVGEGIKSAPSNVYNGVNNLASNISNGVKDAGDTLKQNTVNNIAKAQENIYETKVKLNRARDKFNDFTISSQLAFAAGYAATTDKDANTSENNTSTDSSDVDGSTNYI